MKIRRSNPVLAPALALFLLGALLIATPALAAPTQDAGSPWQLVAQWWDALTAPFASLLGAPAPAGDLSTVTGAALHTCDPNGVAGAARHTCDPDGLAAAASCAEEGEPPVTTEARHTCDPNG